MDVRQYGPDDIALMLRQRGRLDDMIDAIERRNSGRVLKLLDKVIPHDDGTLLDMYLHDPKLLANLKEHR